MEIDRRSVDQAVAGDWVSFQVSETNRSVFTRGMVAGDANCDPPKGAKSIVATVCFVSPSPFLFSSPSSSHFIPLVPAPLVTYITGTSKAVSRKDFMWFLPDYHSRNVEGSMQAHANNRKKNEDSHRQPRGH